MPFVHFHDVTPMIYHRCHIVKSSGLAEEVDTYRPAVLRRPRGSKNKQRRAGMPATSTA
jgi:hypothetical protein